MEHLVDLDAEWIEMLLEAKELGMTIEEVKTVLKELGREHVLVGVEGL